MIRKSLRITNYDAQFELIAYPRKLSTEAMSALQAFYNERDEQQRNFEDLKLKMEAQESADIKMSDFTEDWNASQFWV
jgi:hypothetical protein